MQFLAEALTITFIGGVLGVILAYTVALSVGRLTLYSAFAKNGEAGDIRLIIAPGDFAGFHYYPGGCGLDQRHGAGVPGSAAGSYRIFMARVTRLGDSGLNLNSPKPAPDQIGVRALRVCGFRRLLNPLWRQSKNRTADMAITES